MKTLSGWKRWSCLGLLVAGLLIVSGCPKKKEPEAPPEPTPAAAPALDPGAEVTVREREQLHTRVTITLPGGETPEKIAAIDAAFAEIDRLETLLDEWKEGTQVAEVNAKAGREPVKVSDEIIEVVETARKIASRSQGAFDLTIGALRGAWDFRQQDPKIPTAEELAPRLKLVSYRKLVLDPEARTIFLEEEGMKLALGGISRGYAVDRASAVLKERGFTDHLVVAGGDLYASGKRGDRPWRVGIRDPRSSAVHSVVELEDRGMATSGNYERYFEKDGVRYHHILDPRTGQPARGFSSVTVQAPNATLADGWATALFVRGPRFALVEAKQIEGIEVLFFSDTDFQTSGTPGLLAALIDPATLKDPKGPDATTARPALQE
ncbi:MAG: FAD:protein FMN transferase [Deltaproteobacteria bacterium]|nr:FAD:protein FMN transferase [Deltaproteobacteria bacterium]